MKLALATPTPEVKVPLPLALLSGSFAERLAKAVCLGYDGVELIVVRPGELDPATIRSQVAEQKLEIAAISSGALYTVDQLTLLAADADVSQRAAARLQALIDFAAAVGARLVTIGSFRGWLAGAGGERARDKLVEILKKAAIYATERDVRLVLEPLNRYETDAINNIGEALVLLKEVGNSHLGLLLDTFHVNIEEPSVTECFRQGMASGLLWHVHLGDSNRLPPGQGHIDFARIVATLNEAGYVGYLCAELLPHPDPDSASAATIRYMRQFVPAKKRGTD